MEGSGGVEGGGGGYEGVLLRVEEDAPGYACG